MMKAEIYTQDRFSDFVQIKITDEKERVPSDHYHIGVVVKEWETPLAKAVLYINPDLDYQDKKVGLIGAYAAQENQQIVTLLFQTIKQLATEEGINFLIGPMNGSTWESYRFHDTFDKPFFFLEMKHPGYYPKQWQEAGFRPISTYYSAMGEIVPRDNAHALEIEKRLHEDGIIIREIDLGHYEEELHRLYPFLHESFKHNFLYTPISKNSFLDKYLSLHPMLNPGFVRIAEYNGEIVGVLLGVSDIGNPSSRSLIVKTLARHPDRLYRGLGLVLYDQVYQMGLRNGYQHIINAFMIDDGDATPLSRQYNINAFKTYTLYGTAI